MFLRKLCVTLLPLMMLALLCLLLPLIQGLGFWDNVIKGACLGILLALVLPLSGATRRREAFAGLLWIPALLTLLVILYQSVDAAWPVLSLLKTTDGQVVFMESAFAGFLMTECLRTRR